jgi:DNA-directed RNA polymerase subunit RPC12/RpoP
MAIYHSYATCDHCGSDLEEVQEDLDGSNLKDMEYICPECKSKLLVTSRTTTEYLVEVIHKGEQNERKDGV